MGLYIHAVINLKGISDNAWEAAWHESLDIFSRFPLPLSRHSIETKLGEKRHVYSTDLIRHKGTEKECWYLEGDLLSRQTAETFVLNRHLAAYKSKKVAYSRASVFKTNELEYASSTNGIELWNRKTQGYPFHLAILAVGIMLENKFPDNCYLYGDSDENQVAMMLDWLETTYKKSFLKPICFDADRLFQKLNAVYIDKKALLKRFARLYQGGKTNKFKALLQFMDKKEVYDHYAKELNDFDSLDQWGAQDIMRMVLEASESVLELVAFMEHTIAKRPKKSEVFDWGDVLSMLCEDYIFVNPIHREPIKRLTGKGEDMDDIDNVFGRFLMKMVGAPYISPLYVPKDELLEIFALRDPKNGKKYHAIIEEAEAKLAAMTQEAEATIEALEEEIDEDTELQENMLQKKEMLEGYAPHERYIVQQALQQQHHFEDYDTNLVHIRESLDRLMKKHHPFYDKNAVEDFLKEIYHYSFKSGFGVSEKGWNVIDTQTNLTILKYLFVLASIKNNETTFWQWRKHIFETPETWKYFL